MVEKNENNVGKGLALDLCKSSNLKTPGNFPSSFCFPAPLLSFSPVSFHVFLSFPVSLIKGYLKGQGLILAHSSRLQSVMAVNQAM